MIKQECIGIPDMILLLMIFCFKKIKIKAEIVLSPGGAYFLYSEIRIRMFVFFFHEHFTVFFFKKFYHLLSFVEFKFSSLKTSLKILICSF